VTGNQAQQGAADQDLVADRVEDRAPDGHGVQLAGQPAVEEVGDGGDHERPERPALQPQLILAGQALAEVGHGPRRGGQGHEHEQGHDEA
jgi:hypothetical protein